MKTASENKGISGSKGTARRAFIYARQSSGSSDPNDSLSIIQQVKNCSALAEKLNISVIGTFEDANIPGYHYPKGEYFEKTLAIDKAYLSKYEKGIRYREGLGKLFERINEIDCILIEDITRLHRSEGNSFLEYAIIEKLKEKRVKVICVSGGEKDFENFNDTLIEYIQTKYSSQLESSRKKKSKDVLHSLKDNGFKVTCHSFGVKRIAKSKYEYEHRRMRVVKYIYKAYLNGVSKAEISYQLNSHKKIRSLSFGKEFSAMRVSRILGNPLYFGYMYDTSNQLIKCKNIIPFFGYDIFEKVQKKLQESKERDLRVRPNVRRGKANYVIHPFSSLLYCKCGKRLVVQTSDPKKNQRVYYYCQNKNFLKSEECRKSTIYISEIDNPHIQGLREAVLPLILNTLIKKYKEISSFKLNSDQIEKLKIELKNLQKKQENLYQQYIENNINSDLYNRFNSDIQKRIKEKEKEYNTLIENSSINKESELKIIVEKINYLIFANEIPDSELQSLLHDTFERITVYENMIEFSFKSGEKFSLDRVKGRKAKYLPTSTIQSSKKFIDPKNVFEVCYFYSNFTTDSEGVFIPSKKATKTLLCSMPNMNIYRVD